MFKKSGRSRIAVNGSVSSIFPLKQEVPREPLALVFDILLEKHLPSVYSYADDLQLYVAFSPKVPGECLRTFDQLATYSAGVSKLSEKEAAIQPTDHVTAIGLHMQPQSVCI